MLTKTFIMFPNISYKREQMLLALVKNWNGFLSFKKVPFFSSLNKINANKILSDAKMELFEFNSSFFKNFLKPKDMWRLYNEFKENVLFLDIETNGLGKNAKIFMIGLYDGYDTKVMFEPFDIIALQNYINTRSLIVTYNGSSHDIPLLIANGININIPHIDLKIILQSMGFKGGLKKIEKVFGIKRNPIQDKFKSGDIYRLWRMYKASGDEYYLNILLEYNEDDIFYLKKLMDYTYSYLTGFFYNKLQ